MWCSKVLVAYDGSEPSKCALDVAREIAEFHPDAEFVFAYAMRIFPTEGLSVDITEAMVEEAKYVENQLQEFAETIPNKSEVVVLKGVSVSELLLKCSRTKECTVIVIGSRGRTGIRGYLGSVSTAVVQAADIPVLVARDEREEDD